MIVVFGPRTRLAGALLALAARQARGLVLVGRDPAEAQALASEYPDAVVVQGCEDDGRFPQAAKEVAVVFCALGLIHPEHPRLPAHPQRLDRDLEAFRRVVTVYQQVPIHAVFVSSVVALGTPRRRAYYGGWKGVSEGAIGALLRDHPRPRFSVIFPGRLVEERSLRRPDSLLATPYEHLARTILEVIEGDRTQSRVMGPDARLWLLARTLELGVAAISGRVPTVALYLRDAPPNS